MKFKMFSCKEISKVSCHEEELKGFDKLNYKMHLFMCDKCRKYVAGLKFVQEKFSSLLKRRSEINETKIKVLEDEILDRLKSKNGNE
ncbi:hypothetical protein A9Q84_06650 [Halobacteriovorax marinus]|uniref:Zinc-finger domain-containing protein n=1 Tax=Halobacteriovorax marinus TaxID=97084 RepID=A0A1Y5F9J5_9BACT|nr:hypothetical protein A9Q84_06650 [Halobacteriovorax marinus]